MSSSFLASSPLALSSSSSTVLPARPAASRMASAVLSAVSFAASADFSTGFSSDFSSRFSAVSVRDGFGDAVPGDGLAVSLSGPSKRSLSASPTPSGSSGFLVFVGVGEALGAAAGASAPAAFVLGSALSLADGVVEGFGAVVSPWSPEPVAVADGVGVGDDEFDADGEGSSLGSSERVTQGPGAKGMSELSSASASLG